LWWTWRGSHRPYRGICLPYEAVFWCGWLSIACIVSSQVHFRNSTCKPQWIFLSVFPVTLPCANGWWGSSEYHVQL
jgi:hypothetical protein